jgi:hypothetical protein
MSATLSCVTLTGADEAVDPAELEDIRKKYPVVEWAILLAPGHMGKSRHPGREWIEEFLETCKGRKSLHLCFNAISSFVAGEAPIMALAKQFNRIQLNFASLANLPDSEALDEAIRSFHHPVILQHGRGSAKLLARLSAPNRQVLFDESGGTGKLPEQWPQPLPNVKCGYAGGLKPDNLRYQLPKIFKAAGKSEFWIDMESGIRDGQGNFDTGLAREALKISQAFRA